MAMNEATTLPIISVIIPTYNHVNFIEQAVRSAVDQSKHLGGRMVEVLCLDDGSTDGTAEVLSELDGELESVRIFLFEHVGIEGLSGRLNDMIDEARGEYVAFLGGDDFYVADRFQSQLKMLKNSKSPLAYSLGTNFNCISDDLGFSQKKYMIEQLRVQSARKLAQFICHNIPTIFLQGALIDRKLLCDIGGFDSDLLAEDWVLNIKMLKKCAEENKNFVFLEEVTFRRRFHDTNTSQDMPRQKKRVIEVIDRYTPENKRKAFKAKIMISYAKKLFRERKLYQSAQFLAGSFLYFPANIKYVLTKLVGN